MRFKLTSSSGQLERVCVLGFAVLLTILAQNNGAAQKIKRKKNVAACNENCQRTKCDVRQTCNKISSLNRSYDCFECKDCVNMRKYEAEVKPNDVFKLDEECLHIRVQCGPCPACPKAVPLVLPSKPASIEESRGERAVRIEDHEFYKYWCALVVSVAFNLLLLCIIISCRPKSSKKARKDEDEYENVSWIEMAEQK